MTALEIFPLESQNLRLTPTQKFAVILHILAQFGASLGHNASIPGSPAIYGNICMVLIGKSGCGKGLAYSFAESLFDDLPLSASKISAAHCSTKNRLLSAISIESCCYGAMGIPASIFHINENFSGQLTAMSKNSSGLAEYINQLIDARPIREKLSGQPVNYPYIHYGFMGHIAPEEMPGALKVQLITGGNAGRFLWIPFPENMEKTFPVLTEREKMGIRKELTQSLLFAAQHGPLPIEEEGRTLLDTFHSSCQNNPENEGLSQIICRFPMQVKKIALVLALLRRKHIITSAEISEAITLISMSRQALEEYFLPLLPHPEERAILAQLKIQGKATQSDLLAALSLKNFSESKLKKVLRDMTQAGKIKYYREEQGNGSFPYLYALAE